MNRGETPLLQNVLKAYGQRLKVENVDTTFDLRLSGVGAASPRDCSSIPLKMWEQALSCDSLRVGAALDEEATGRLEPGGLHRQPGFVGKFAELYQRSCFTAH